jgi:small GTP-binding protein
MRILKQEQEALLREERRLMNDLQVVLLQFGMEEADHGALAQSIDQLDEFFLIVVVGEFNSGKSAVINALLGQKVLEEGVTPTTNQIQIICQGEGSRLQDRNPRQRIFTFPAEFLAELTIVDTPGTNAIIREHEVLTVQFIPRSDLVLFVTSADRPFTESERAFLEMIRSWGKKIILVINKIDILRDEKEREEVEGFVRNHARKLLGEAPQILLLSAREAFQGKQGEAVFWEKSRFEHLERFIRESLDESNRLRLKLLNPLGVGAHLAEIYSQKILSRLEFLQEDLHLLQDVDRQLAAYEEDMERHFRFRMSDLDNILLEMEKRGQSFFDETFRIGRVLDLLSKPRIQQAFERQVVVDVPLQIERKVQEMIDWMVDSNLRRWQDVHQHLVEKGRQHQDRMIGKIGSEGFEHDRRRLLEALSREARRVVETYDRDREAKTIAESALHAVAASAALEAGALGLGALVTALATTAAADVTGILMAGGLALIGFFIIPARRRQGKTRMLEKIAALRTQLMQTLQAQFAQEIKRSIQQIHEAIAPYARFIRTEKEKLLGMKSKLENLQGEMNRLRSRIEGL